MKGLVWKVLLTHFFVVGVIALSHGPTAAVDSAHITVREVQLEPPKKQPVVQAPSPKPKPAARPPTPPAKPVKRINKKLLQQAQERIAKIPTSVDKRVALPTPSARKRQLQIDLDVPLSKELERSEYAAELAKRLELALRLPEYGEVRIELTLTRGGKVATLNVIEAHSQRNRDYVAQTVPKLSLAPFGNEYRDEAQHTFNLTLRNA